MWAEIKGSSQKDQLFLTDTGATVSIMPIELYCSIHHTVRRDLFVSDRTITAANSTRIEVIGMGDITVILAGRELTHKFYVCQDATYPIFGVDFQRAFDLYVRPGHNKIYLGDRQIPAFDSNGYYQASKVTLEEAAVVPPQSESVLVGRISSNISQDGKPCIINQTSTTLIRTGALLCKVVATPNEGRVPMRVLNCHDEPLQIPKGSLMGILEPVTKLVPWKDKLTSDDEGKDSCTCKCSCDDLVPVTLSPAQLAVVTSTPVKPETEVPTKVDLEQCVKPKIMGTDSALQSERKKMFHFMKMNSWKTPPPGTCCHKLEEMTHEERYDEVLKFDEHQPGFLQYHQVFEVSTEVPEHVRELYNNSTRGLTTQQKNRLASLLTEYQDRFAKHSDDVGRTTLLKHHIDTGDSPPVRQRCRRFAKCHIEAIQEHVRKLSEAGIIRPSDSEWASNCVVVKKKDGTWRLCIDYRELNEKTKNPDSYLLPRIDDTLDALSNAKYFCTLDLLQGYHQVELTESSKEKTAFHAPFCNPSQWEYVYMPFGLVKAPRTFQRLMDRVIQGLEYRVALAYIDDIIVYARDIDGCIDNMQLVLERLRNANLKLKAKKCILFAHEVEYLGHVITSTGVKTDPKKIEAVKEWHPPRTTRQVRSFLGIATYYNRFIKNFAEVAQPLTELTKRTVKFHWTDAHQQAFDRIRELLIQAPIMAYPRRDGMFILDTDASDRCYGGVLSQMQPEEGTGNMVERVIAYASKKFTGTEQMYCARRRELLAIIRLVKYFNVYLRGTTFLIRTDHASLRYIKTVRELPAQFFRWIMFLEEYSYRIEIRKGVLHGNADAMSRGCHGKGCICEDLVRWEQRQDIRAGTVMHGNISALDVNFDPEVHPTPVSKVCSSTDAFKECDVAAYRLQPVHNIRELAIMQEEDPDVAPVLKAKKADPDKRPPWNDISSLSPAAKAYFAEWKRLCIYQGALYRLWENHDGSRIHRQLIVPKKLQREFCERIHDTSRTAHMGRRRMMHALQHFCYWYRMHEDAMYWIKSCEICQQRKRLNPAPRAPMTVYVVGAPGERISIDVCGPLVETPRHNRYVLVISDHFTKYTKAVPMKDQTAETVARVLMTNWILDHGEPMQLHSDQGRNFESKLIEEFCKLHGIEKSRTTPYHPQADGQVERFNKTLIDLICKLAGQTEDWDERVPIVVAAYNGTIHDSTGYTPNLLMRGREVLHSQSKIVPDPVPEAPRTYNDYVKKLKEHYEKAYESTRNALRKAALVHKKYYDRKANLYKYRPGEAVWITNHAPPTVTGTRKFVPKYVGPYWVIDVLSDIHFRIQEKEGSTPKVVHHDRLKPYVFRVPTETPDWVKKASRALTAAELARSTEPEQIPETAVPATQDLTTGDDQTQTDIKDPDEDLGTRQEQVPNDDSAETPVTEPVSGTSSDLSQRLDDPPVTAGTSDVTPESQSEDEVEDPLATDTVVPPPRDDVQPDQTSEAGTPPVPANDDVPRSDDEPELQSDVTPDLNDEFEQNDDTHAGTTTDNTGTSDASPSTDDLADTPSVSAKPDTLPTVPELDYEIPLPHKTRSGRTTKPNPKYL